MPSILVTLFCCLPGGIVAIVFAAQVDSKWNSGDVAGAQHSAKKAKEWTLASAILGIAVVVVSVLAVTLLGSSTSARFEIVEVDDFGSAPAEQRFDVGVLDEFTTAFSMDLPLGLTGEVR